VRGWAIAGEEMDRIKCEELRSLTAEQSATRINDVMLMADRWLGLTENKYRDSGLVEQQRIFMKGHANAKAALSSSPLSFAGCQVV
jgi:hypothetical protein